MALTWPKKDPDEVLDYVLDWSKRLGTTDTIQTVEWTVPAGLNTTSSTHTDSAATIWLTGGVNGEQYDILCRIVTTEGRTMDQTVRLKIGEK